MNEQIQVYFEDPEDSLSKLVKALEFQKGHRVRLNANYRTVVS